MLKRKKARMNISFFQVNAFTSRQFSGNPAVVCLPKKWLEDDQMQKIAAENNVSETAFIVPEEKTLLIRWFTPVTEVALCGHATLAAAYVLSSYFDNCDHSIPFKTLKSGILSVSKRNGLFEMDFPCFHPMPLQAPNGLEAGLGQSPQRVFSAGEDIMAVFDSQEQIRELKPDMSLLSDLECRGVIATAKGQTCDFVSRFFAPRFGIPEDPVTGSAHCVLAPYWSNILGKKRLHAEQLSQRGGEVFCEARGNRVLIAGNAVLYSEGMIKLY